MPGSTHCSSPLRSVVCTQLSKVTQSLRNAQIVDQVLKARIDLPRQMQIPEVSGRHASLLFFFVASFRKRFRAYLFLCADV